MLFILQVSILSEQVTVSEKSIERLVSKTMNLEFQLMLLKYLMPVTNQHNCSVSIKLPPTTTVNKQTNTVNKQANTFK